MLCSMNLYTGDSFYDNSMIIIIIYTAKYSTNLLRIQLQTSRIDSSLTISIHNDYIKTNTQTQDYFQNGS